MKQIIIPIILVFLALPLVYRRVTVAHMYKYDVHAEKFYPDTRLTLYDISIAEKVLDYFKINPIKYGETWIQLSLENHIHNTKWADDLMQIEIRKPENLSDNMKFTEANVHYFDSRFPNGLGIIFKNDTAYRLIRYELDKIGKPHQRKIHIFKDPLTAKAKSQ